ncbi:uncharacterized protein LOC113360276 [Papaver somniferum]|uniref:uncharacterized protein LOC113360276 n=1 Tax=Papaver somniferum TaxID=3469 RepID=UPI000E6FC570|nr:uncharacterized protein LOC113360276 [Papaver somniferum]
MSCVPDDAYLKILARLPVKSLLTCKCVSKSWYQIISDPYFAKMHHDHAAQNNNNLPSIIARGEPRGSLANKALYSIHHDIPLSQVDNVVELDYPFKSLNCNNTSLMILGSTNGLICLRYRKHLTGTDSWKTSQTVPYVFRLCQGVLFKGALYWFGKPAETGTSEFIISLDVRDEEFKKLQLLNQLSDHKLYMSMTMGVLEQRLCVFVNTGVDLEV